MPNYYEMLKIQPSATLAEIETAIEGQYNQWRRLVTHHDPNIVNQANQSLQLLETIRTILTDSAKRNAYDTGISGPVDGLADPEAVLRAAPSSLPRQPLATKALSSTDRTDAWVCPSCQTNNLLKARFCSRCGLALGINCPNCGNVIKSDTVFCPDCGAKVKDLLRQREAAAEARKFQEIEEAKQWEFQTLERARRSGVNPQVAVLIMSAPYKQSFDTVIDQIENIVLRQKRFRANVSDFKQGFIYATLQNTNIEIHAYVQRTEVTERKLIIACSGRAFLGGNLPRTIIDDLVDRLTREHYARRIG